MKNITIFQSLLFTSVLSISSISSASYDETVSGDLSGDIANPTFLITPLNGSSIVKGSVGNNGNSGATNGNDADIFTFSLGAQTTLIEINVLSVMSNSFENQSFMGYKAGTFFSGQTSSDIDGGVLFSNASSNILPALSFNPIGTNDFNGGNHSFWIQETSDIIQSYELEFVFETTAVPIPAAGLLFFNALGLMSLLSFSRKRKIAHKSKTL